MDRCEQDLVNIFCFSVIFCILNFFLLFFTTFFLFIKRSAAQPTLQAVPARANVRQNEKRDRELDEVGGAGRGGGEVVVLLLFFEIIF